MASPSDLPIYQRTAEQLIREIAAGRLLDGERLPPERDLAADLGISVGTLRKSLADLQQRGLLERRQGSGNYIRTGPEAAGLYAFFRLELADGGGGLPTAKVISVAELEKPNDAPAFGRASTGHRIRRLRSVGGVPAALEEVWLDGDRAAKITASDLSESLYLYYRDELGLVITRAEDRVGLQTVPGWAPEMFTLEPGSAAGFVERIGTDQYGTEVEYSRTWFDASRLRYVMRLK